MSSDSSAAPALPVLLASSDPVFAALCKRAFEAGTNPLPMIAVSPPDLLDATRRFAHEAVILDTDGEDVAELKALATKVMLVSDAPIVLVSAYLAPGSPGLSTLLQSIAATFVQKPEGPSSLSLAADDGPPFVAALRAALAAQEQEEVPPERVDSGWDLEEEVRVEKGGAVDE